MSYRGYKQTKILIIGPPSCGKTNISKILNNKFKIPLINTKELMDLILNSNSEFSNQVKEWLNAIK